MRAAATTAAKAAGVSTLVFLVGLSCGGARAGDGARGGAGLRSSLAFLPPSGAGGGAELSPGDPANLSDAAGPEAKPALEKAAPSGETTAPGPEKAAETPALAPLNAAVKAALEARAEPEALRRLSHAQRRDREAVAAFYVARGFAPLWWTDGKPNSEALSATARLERAAEDGLNLKTFLRPAPANGADEAQIAAADIALSDAVVAYGRQASGARLDPQAISRLIGARPELAEPSLILASVANAGADAGAALVAFNPPHEGYAALRRKLAELRRARGPAGARAPAIPAGPVLRVGMRDPRVPLIRARLSLDGRPAESVEDLVYDQRVASAVADFQKANGLPASGLLTPRTIAVLSGGEPSRLEAEIIANMERWRWMPREMGERRIEVNIPDFEVVVIDGGRVVQRNRVVVGKEETPTPIFSNAMKFLIVNPAWNVPQSIIKKEMIGKLGYLSKHGYQVSSNDDGRITVRQPPGERNALGQIKFMFPNDYSVYLHDTPSRALFSETRRAFSHGCVRVDEPFSFAGGVLGPKWSEERLKKLIGGGKERYVNLPAPLPIHIEYFTAFVDGAGRLQLRDDLYGYSGRVRAALGL